MIVDSLPYLASVTFYAIFITRSAFRVGQVLYFSLFDDAMVAMVYGRNLAEGRGLVWNLSERVEGYTNFLWTLWMGALHLLPVPESKISLLVMISGAGILLANIAVVSRIAAELSGSRGVRLASMWLTGLYYPLVYWTLRGMEVGLVTLGISVMTLLIIRWWNGESANLAGLGVVMALMVLVRTELVIVCGLFILFVAFTSPKGRRTRSVMTLALPVLVTLAAHTLFRLAYYGDPLPNTYYLKMQGVSLQERLHRGIPALGVTLRIHLYAPIALAAAFFVARGPSAGRAAWLLASIAAVLMAYSVYVGGDAWEWMLYANRYITPAGPVLLILATLGADEILRSESPIQRRAAAAAVIILVAIECLPFVDRPSQGLLVPAFISVRGPQVGAGSLIALLLAIVLIVAPRRRSSAALLTLVAKAEPVAIAFVVFCSVNGLGLINWNRYNAANFTSIDRPSTEYGLALRQATDPKATLLVGGAGAVPYFSHRVSVDILGKCDSVVAHMHPVGVFYPGHSKWDYGHSIGELRPDLIAQLQTPTDKDIERIEAWGYERCGRKVFVRKDSKLVNPTLVRQALASIRGIPAT